jgi:hypothetical protein
MRRKMTEPIAAPVAVRAAVPVPAAALTSLGVAAAALVFVQKLVPEQRVVYVPLPLAIVGLGIMIVYSPALVPGLNPRM